jgi:predicted amidophosphoribosyltransferase
MNNVQYIFDYTPYFHGGANDRMSRLLLSFKRGHDSAYRFFLSLMINYFDLSEYARSKTVVCCVPSHDAALYFPLQKLCSMVATECGFIDGTHLIRKMYPTESFCRSGIRDSRQLKESLQIDEIIKGLRVVLLDDVTTTGTSFSVISKLLMEAGAGSVECVALGQTVKLTDRRVAV